MLLANGRRPAISQARFVPQFAAGVPSWVRRNPAAFAGMLCMREMGPTKRRLRRGEFPVGPNMALRREALASNSFDERVGRNGDEQVRGGESSLFWNLEQQGFQGAWVPEAKVLHYVPACRADIQYLWRYYHGLGRSHVRLGVVCGAYSRWRILVWTLKEVAKSGLWCWVWARHLATVALLSGQLSELGQQLFPRVVDGDESEGSRDRP